VEVTLRCEGRLVGREALDPRTVDFRHASIVFDGPGRQGALEVDIRQTDAAGRTLPLPSGSPPAVTDPTLFDRDGVRGVVLVSIDTLRRDHVGLYGYPRGTTPRLDAWARAGVVVRDAVSVSSWTLPAHLSMLTSVEPARHGGVDGHHGFNRSVPSLAQTFRQAGFTTHAITSHLYVSPAYGLDAGFDVFDYGSERRAAEVADRALQALEGFGDRPFFLLLHFYDPHWPYAAPEPHRGAFGAVDARDLDPRPPAESRPAAPGPYRDAYDAEIHYTDSELGRVFDYLDHAGLSAHTLVTVTSDHGEEFGEHGEYEHLRTLYEEIIRVPLVIRAPRLERGPRGGAVSLLDLAPTLVEGAGLSPEPSHRGRSLLQPSTTSDAYGETDLAGFLGKRRIRRLFLRSGEGGGKLILTMDRRSGDVLGEEWFDLARDPGEREPSQRPASMAASTWRDRLLDRWHAARRTGGQGPDVALTDEERERLRALGYVSP